MTRKTKPKAEERPAAPPARLAWGVDEFARAAGISRSAAYEDIASGLLVARKRGARTIILADEGERYLNSLPVFVTSTEREVQS